MSFPEKNDAYTAGWGNAPDNFEHMDLVRAKLRQNQRSVVKEKQCRKRYEGIDMEHFFCVGEEYQERYFRLFLCPLPRRGVLY